jgi:hypothetical protein
MPFYVTTRLRNTPSRPQREAFAPRTMWLLGRPEVGRSMALVDSEGQSVITSRIQRILHGGSTSDAVYVQTHNSLYQLQRVESQRAEARHAQQEQSQH